MRITVPLLKVLEQFLLQPTEQISGADIVQNTRLASGTLYPLLKRLEEANWLSSQWEDVLPEKVGRPRRRLYQITGLGSVHAKAAFRDTFAHQGVPVWSSVNS